MEAIVQPLGALSWGHGIEVKGRRLRSQTQHVHNRFTKCDHTFSHWSNDGLVQSASATGKGHL
jgi:hypothetical protein